MKVGRTFDYRCNGVIDIIQYMLTNFSSKLYLHFLFYRVYFSSLLSNLITLEINNYYRGWLGSGAYTETLCG